MRLAWKEPYDPRGPEIEPIASLHPEADAIIEVGAHEHELSDVRSDLADARTRESIGAGEYVRSRAIHMSVLAPVWARIPARSGGTSPAGAA